ncbi:MAG: divalent-cation tolerance protein CutA [Acidimicrobiales bacterium]
MPNPRPAVVQVVTATGSSREAAALADMLLTARLAACVQVWGPVESRYWWQGRIESATEWLCVAKTTADRLDAAVAAVAQAHSYDLPEVVVTPVVGGYAPYLDWVATEAYDGIRTPPVEPPR